MNFEMRVMYALRGAGYHPVNSKVTTRGALVVKFHTNQEATDAKTMLRKAGFRCPSRAIDENRPVVYVEPSGI